MRTTSKIPMRTNKVEADFSADIRWNFRQEGIKSFKTNDRVNRGIPDIYLVGGKWIESKVLISLPNAMDYPLKHFSALQRNNLDDLSDGGDECFVAILFYKLNEPRFLVMPWYYFRRINVWHRSTTQYFTHPYYGKTSMRLSRFGFDGGYWNENWWLHNIWYNWKHHNDRSVWNPNINPAEIENAPEDNSGSDQDGSGDVIIRLFEGRNEQPSD